jgi:ribosomal protein S12 methylthiotransferase accessory factor
MRIRDCYKGFNAGVGKVMHPEETCRGVLKKLKACKPAIMAGYFKVKVPSGIPQYKVVGSEYFRQIIQSKKADGKGHSDKQALASGLMELVERFSCCKYLSIRNGNIVKIASFGALKNNLFRPDDFYSICTGKLNSRLLKNKKVRDAKVAWYGGYTLHGEVVYLPMGLIRDFVGSNGMASGNSLEEALLHAICEVIERHCLNRIESERLSTPFIDPSTVNSSVAIKLMKAFRSLKQPVFIKDFSLGLGLPVIGVIRKINKRYFVVTAGVATSREEALIRALTENSQVGVKANYQNSYSHGYHFINNPRFNKKRSFRDIINIDDKNMRIELENIEKILDKQGMRVFFVDTTDKILNVPSVMAYIAGAKETPPNRNLLIAVLNQCLDTENYRDARGYINIGKEIDKKGYYNYIYYEGVILKRANRYREAAVYFQQVLAKTEIPELKRMSLVNAGLCYQALGEIDKAINYYTKTVILDPEYNLEDLVLPYNTVLSKEKWLFESAKILYQVLKSRWLSRLACGDKKKLIHGDFSGSRR